MLNSKKRLFIVYPNGYIESHKWFKENDNEIQTRNGKQIIATKEHCGIDSEGKRYYFVNGNNDYTTDIIKINTGELYNDFITIDENGLIVKKPLRTFKPFEGEPPKPFFNRESMFKIHQNLLVKSMHELTEVSKVMLLFYLIVGAGAGWMACDSFGNNEVYNQQEYNENYYPETPKNNDTVIITSNVRGFDLWNGIIGDFQLTETMKTTITG